MVTLNGDIKLLDFGISHILENDNMSVKSAGFTPHYAAPELKSSHKISMAADVYSSGVILYELLTKKSFESVTQSIKSMQLKHSELAAIISIALEENPNNRYATISDFKNDINNYLKQKPVSAFSQHWFYRYKKFVQRHYWMHLAYLLLVVSLVGGIVSTRQQFKKAQAEAKRVNTMQGFVKEILTSVDPWKNKRKAVTVNQIIINATEKLPHQLDKYPQQKAAALLLLGDMLTRLDLQEKAAQINLDAHHL